jgi:hypothetical protein
MHRTDTVHLGGGEERGKEKIRGQEWERKEGNGREKKIKQ